MKNKIIGICLLVGFIVFLIYSSKESYKLFSPDNKNYLVFTWHHSFINKSYISISIQGRKDASISIKPLMDYPILIYWGDTIKVRGGLLVKNNNPTQLINWKFDQTAEEIQEIKRDTNIWKSYYLEKILSNSY